MHACVRGCLAMNEESGPSHTTATACLTYCLTYCLPASHTACYCLLQPQVLTKPQVHHETGVHLQHHGTRLHRVVCPLCVGARLGPCARDPQECTHTHVCTHTHTHVCSKLASGWGSLAISSAQARARGGL